MATERRVRLYPPHDPETAAKVGIPRSGELYSADDARRLVGGGLAARRPRPPAEAPRSRGRGSAERKPVVKPAREG